MTLLSAILKDECENCGTGVVEKVRDVGTKVPGRRLVTGERSRTGVALEIEEKRARREVGGLIWKSSALDFEEGQAPRGGWFFIGR